MSNISTLIWPSFADTTRRKVVLVIRLGGLLGLAGWALSTPGVISLPSFFALLNAISFIGCVAVGMTFITLTGNIMSLALGATLSGAALVFLATLTLGVIPAFILAILFGIIITALQGAVIGWLKANPILVSIAALALLLGTAQIVTSGQSVYPAAPGSEIFKTAIAGIPVSALFFFVTVVIGQLILSYTRYGLAMTVMMRAVRRRQDSARLASSRSPMCWQALLRPCRGCCSRHATAVETWNWAQVTTTTQSARCWSAEQALKAALARSFVL